MTKNQRRIGDHAFSGAAIALVAAFSFAAGAPAVPAQAAAHAQQGAGTAAQQQAGSLLVLPASELIGRPLKDSQGHDAGQVQAMVLDTENGAIDFVVIGGNGNFDLNGGVIAVPWSTLEPPASAQGALTVKASADKLRQAPRLNQNAVADLSEPRSRANIYSYYGYPNRGPRSGYGERGTSYGVAPVGGNGGAVGPYGAPGGYAGGRAYYGPGNGNASGNGASAAGNPGVGGAGQAANRPQGNAGGRNETAGNQAPSVPASATQAQPTGQQRELVQNGLVVGRKGVVSALRSPTTSTASAMPSAGVVASNGATVGRVDQVLLDPEHGEIAFILLERGGFLGLNPSWYAVPPEALRWVPNAGGYQLTVNEKLLRSEPSVPVNENHLPTHVELGQLAQLYRHFGIAPYWQQAAQSASQDDAQSGSSQPH